MPLQIGTIFIPIGRRHIIPFPNGDKFSNSFSFKFHARDFAIVSFRKLEFFSQPRVSLDTMNTLRHPIAVIGAGPSGSWLASLLAQRGLPILLFHAAGAKKHCGGGIPARTLDDFPLLRDLSTPRREIYQLRFIAPSGNSCDLALSRPVSIFDRSTFDEELRTHAHRNGAHLITERVRSIRKEGDLWSIQTDGSEHQAGFLVGADGASGIVRRTVSQCHPASSFSLCAGYYFDPPDKERITIGLLRRSSAYTWLFPQPGPASAGIASPLTGIDRNTLLEELRSWMERIFPGVVFDYSRPYSALVPTYRKDGIRAFGEAWALVGDAAGVAEPVTREGIHFSLKSAELCAEALLGGEIDRYGSLLSRFLSQQHRVALLIRKYLFTSLFAECSIRLFMKSSSVRKKPEKFFSGTLRYRELLH